MTGRLTYSQIKKRMINLPVDVQIGHTVVDVKISKVSVLAQGLPVPVVAFCVLLLCIIRGVLLRVVLWRSSSPPLRYPPCHPPHPP